jgi:hypothetical protein
VSSKRSENELFFSQQFQSVDFENDGFSSETVSTVCELVETNFLKRLSWKIPSIEIEGWKNGFLIAFLGI